MSGKRISIFLFLSLFGSKPGAAEDYAGAEASRQLQNLVYYPHARIFRLNGQFIGSLQDSGSTENNLGAQTASRSTSYYKASATLAYGLIDGLRLAVSEMELFDQRTQSTNLNNGVVSTNDSHGFSDPSVTVSQRLHDAQDEGFYADLAMGFTPRLGRALAAGNGQSGNNLASAWSASAQLPAYYRWYAYGFANEIELDPSLSRSFGGITSGSTLQSSTLTSSYWYGSVLFQDRFHLNRAWFAQPGVTVNFPYTYYTSSQTPGSANTYQKVDLNASPSLTIGYLPKDWLLISAIVTYSDKGTSSYPATGSSTSAQTSQTYASLQAQLQF